MAQLHMQHPGAQTGPAASALCGWIDVPVTTDAERVECKLCKRAMTKGLLEQLTPEQPFEPSDPEPVEEARRAHILTEQGIAAIRRSIQGQVEKRYRWASAQEALRALAAFRKDGQGVTSTSNPARFERLPMGQGDPTRKAAGKVDDLHGVDCARARAYASPRTFTRTVGEGDEARVERFDLSVAQQLAILDWSMELRIVRDSKHAPADVVPVSAESVASRASAAWGLTVTERQVSLVVRAGLDAVRAHLRAIGEMAPLSAREREAMAVPGYDLSGWEEIEEHSGMSRKVLRKLREQEHDPFPLHEIKGRKGLLARKAEIDAWIKRNAQSTGAGAA